MPAIERLTITMPADLAAVVKAAVEDGEYASASEVIRESLRDWKHKRAVRLQEFAVLKAEIEAGLADLAAGRLVDFDREKIIERGRNLLKARSLIG